MKKSIVLAKTIETHNIMKKFTAIIAAALAFTGASAQYVSLQQGTTYEYKSTIYQENDSMTMTTSAKVISVTEADGKMTVLTEETTPMPDGMFGEKVDTTTTVYNTADKSTTFILSEPEKARQEVIDMIKMQFQASGQFVSEGDMSSIITGIRVKGELSLTINPDMAPGTKLPNKNMRINISQQSMTYNIWNAVVEGTETITVPAGTFECLKVTFVNKINAGDGNQKINVTQWFAPGVGTVKTEQSLKKDEPLLKQELVSFDKPQA